MVSGLLITVETSSASELGSTSEWTVHTILTVEWHGSTFWAVLAEWAAFTRVLLDCAPLLLVGTSWAWKWLNCSNGAVIAWWAVTASDVGDTSGVTVVSHVAVLAVVLVDLLGPGVVGTGFAWVQLTLVDLVISLWWTVMTSWAFSSVSLTVLAEVTWLTSNAISNLSSLSNDALGLKWAWNSHGVTLWTVVTLRALKACRVWSSVELWLGAKETSSAFFSNDTSAAVASSNTLLTVLVTFVHEGTSRADRLTLLSLITNRLSNTEDRCGRVLFIITVVIGWASVTLS